MHIIAEDIRECKKICFVKFYKDIEYNNIKWLKNEIDCIKPLVYGAEKPKILLISQAPSLQAWLNGKISTSPDGGLVSTDNNFFINDLLPGFGLTKKDIDIFKENVFWIHTCNCYPWFREYIENKTGKPKRADKIPDKTQIEKCLGQWKDKLLKIDTLNAVVLMGEPSTRLFPELKEGSERFTELVRKKKIRNDIIEGIEILPIYHQSKRNRTFNNSIDKSTNDELKLLLREHFFKWIN
jgi:uracil-DNA glycosylase